MLLAIHIIFGIVSSISALGIFVSAYKESRSWLVRFVKSAIRFTSLTILSGVILIVDGSSVARVCGESLLLVAFSAGAIYYAKTKNNQEATHAGR